MVIAYLQRKAKQSGNKLAMLVLAIIQCCMYCVEKCMKFMNQTAYIQIAIWGISFCSAAKKAFWLIARNVLRIMAVSIVSQFVLILGKLFITIATTMLFYQVVTQQLGDQMNGIFFPTFLTIGCAFFAASMFNEVFGMAIWTILQCFVADEEMFKEGSDTSKMYAQYHGDLASTIGSSNAAAKRGKPRSKKETEMLQKKFMDADTDNSGEIDAGELKDLLTKITGEAPSDDKVKEMMDEVDHDKSGKIEFEEFCELTLKFLDALEKDAKS